MNASLGRGGGAAGDVRLRPATVADVEAVEAVVEAAYSPWVERIGMRPGPMDDDYAALVDAGVVTVAERGGSVVGIAVIGPGDEGVTLENVAVAPAARGTGVGRALLSHAEAAARAAGSDAIHLYTHERMTENIALYERIGYVEHERREEHGFARVFMRKQLR